uniref:VENT homeobox n=1 Tax=Strigops habroptila TaxID=2489341 RepID=A0A672VEE2_STRHB
MLPDILLPGISETRQDDQGSFLCGVVVPEQPGPQEHHRGLSSSTILRGPPARFRIYPRVERPEQGAARRSAGREKRQEPGARRTDGPGTPPTSGSPRKARLCSDCPEAWLTLSSPFLLSLGAGGRPSGAEQSPPEGSPERTSLEEAGGRSGRRLRTAFSAEQVSTLESSFQRQQYLGAAERRKLAGRMRLSEVQIKTWFQNRRMKLKRQLQELRTESFCSSPLPYGPQSSVVPLPLTYMSQPPPLFREGAASGGFTLAALPAPNGTL